MVVVCVFFCRVGDGVRDLVRSGWLGGVYQSQRGVRGVCGVRGVLGVWCLVCGCVAGTGCVAA